MAKQNIRQLTILGLLTAILFLGQVFLAILPNIEVVSLLIILYTLTCRKKVFLIIYAFVLLEGFCYGFGMWWFSYLYIWSILAPVGLPLKTVSVEITRKWHTAYIAFGSNMGDKKMYIDNGIRGLAETKGCRIEAISDYLITEPYGVTEQDEFLNGVLKMRTLLTPGELLVRLHQLEQEANRERIIHWGPRTLDLDILFYDQEIIDIPDLHIPHIDLHNRDFVLVPMNQIAPYLRHPVLNQTISQLLDSLLNKSENTAK